MSNFVGMPPHAAEASRCRSARAEEARVLKKHLFGFCFVEKTSTIKLQVLFRWPVFNFWALGRLIQLSPCRVKRRWLYRIWRPASWPFEDQQAGHLKTSKLAIWPASWPLQQKKLCHLKTSKLANVILFVHFPWPDSLVSEVGKIEFSWGSVSHHCLNSAGPSFF